jgi:hypothetical protein
MPSVWSIETQGKREMVWECGEGEEDGEAGRRAAARDVVSVFEASSSVNPGLVTSVDRREEVLIGVESVVCCVGAYCNC